MSDEPQVVSISSQTGLHPEEIARRTFPAVRRGGVDGEAVRRFLETVASEVQLLVDREQSVRRRLAEVERRAAEPPRLDEHSLLEAVGAETAKILQAAHDAAGEVVAKAESRAEDVISQADSVLAQQMTAAEAQASALLVAARSEAQLLVEQARSEAVSLLEATRTECRRVIHEARQLRTRVLTDLTDKRRELRVQLEQLRAGRDSLVGVVDAVAAAVDDVRDRLENAEHDARVAAAEAGEEAEESEETGLFDVEADGLRFGGPVFDDSAPDEEDASGVEEEPPMISILAEEEVELLLDEGLAGELATDSGTTTEQSRRSVDELFARIRAGRRQTMDDVVTSDREGADDEEDEGILAGHSAHEAAVLEADGAVLDPEESGEEAPSGEGDPVDTEALRRRTGLLQPPTDKLSRALKRVMRDDQNLLLEALRRASGRPDVDKLLPEEEQRARIAAASSSILASAWRAGHDFLVEGEAPQPDVEAAGSRLAAELAGELTSLVRHRLREVLSPMTEVGDGAAESAGAVYREWRGSRIEAIAADFAVRAFSEGEVSGGGGALVRWVVDDGGRGCPDCDDNSLAGSVIAGEEFPTGHVHPPVHPGCRCLLVPISS